ncbi:MAG: VanZ family protein [candidate division Zixibacteria bacterium]|nr:VanZ family protein [candidate division Zixibacteria bacterium]
MKKQLSFWFPPIGYALLIFVLSSIESASLPSLRFALGDKLIHLGEYGLFGFLFARLFVQLGWNNPYLWAVLFASFYGATDEIHQFYVPGRTMEVYDWIADTLGGFLGSQACRLWVKKFSGKSKAGSPVGQNPQNPNPPAGP